MENQLVTLDDYFAAYGFAFVVTVAAFVCLIVITVNLVKIRRLLEQRQAESKPEPQEWECPKCTFKYNPNTSFTCENCGYKLK